MYRVLKDGFKNPTNDKLHKAGEIIDLFHTVGDKLTTGKKPQLVRSVKVDPNTALAMKLETQKELTT